MEIAVAGSSEFTLGFRLAGIKKVIDAPSQDEIAQLMKDEALGIVIIDQETCDSVSEHMREDMISSIKPVVVTVSAKPQEELRKMIMRSIGVDLLREDKS